jgi:hypothetical protein
VLQGEAAVLKIMCFILWSSGLWYRIVWQSIQAS